MVVSLLHICCYLGLFSNPETNFLMENTQLLLAEFSIMYILVYVCCALYAKRCVAEWTRFENRID